MAFPIGTQPITAPPVAPQPIFAKTPTSPTGLPSFNQFTPTDPGFGEVKRAVTDPINIAPLPTIAAPGTAGQATFERGIETLGPTTGLRPEAQSALDILGERTRIARARGESTAQALSVRRGIPGSSIEQFGVAEAGAQQERVGAEATIPILLENIRQAESSRQFQGSALIDRAKQLEQLTSTQEISRLQAEASRGNQQAQIELNQRLTEAKLISDEIASQRNINAQLEQLEIQRILGERGIAATRENIEAARAIARQQSQDQLLGNVIGAFGPSVLSSIFPSGGAGVPGGVAPAGFAGGGLFSGGLSGAFGGGATRFGTAFARTGASGVQGPLLPGGTLAQPAAFSAGRLFGGLGLGFLGSQVGQSFFGKSRGAAAGAPIGATAGFFLGGPLGAAIGGTVGAGIGKAVGSVTRSVKKIFPF